MKEALLAQYNNSSNNPAIMNQAEAEEFGHSYIGERLVSAIGRKLLDGFISLEIVRVTEVKTRPINTVRGHIIALCERLDIKHRSIGEEVEHEQV